MEIQYVIVWDETYTQGQTEDWKEVDIKNTYIGPRKTYVLLAGKNFGGVWAIGLEVVRDLVAMFC